MPNEGLQQTVDFPRYSRHSWAMIGLPPVQ